jgi:putative flavoprotein involved in K+ transport
LPVLRRRKSTFIHGIEDDAREVIDHLSGYLAGDPRARISSNVASLRCHS